MVRQGCPARARCFPRARGRARCCPCAASVDPSVRGPACRWEAVLCPACMPKSECPGSLLILFPRVRWLVSRSARSMLWGRACGLPWDAMEVGTRHCVGGEAC
eukprot:15043125-Alexandrium_andersonii.AAC.1